MKHLYLSFLFILAAMTANAQLKVDSVGRVGIGSTTTKPNYAASFYGNKSGIYCEAQGNGAGSYAGYFVTHRGDGLRYGLVADAHSSEPSGFVPYSYGVKGTADYGQYCSMGVYGSVGEECTTGSGIYGTDDISDPGVCAGGVFAGYFNGNTKVDGNLTVTGNVNGVMIVPSPSKSSLMREYGDGDVSGMLSGLQASQYKVDVPEPDLDGLPDSLRSKVLERQRKNIIGQQYQEKNHYALSAEQLEEVFPDLVYENEDGSKGINYMEMIPLLVQSINELNARIQELEGNGEMKAPSRASSTTSVGAGAVSARNTVLYQNTPNPFHEQTTIRFRLADDARDASICIFDMTGKMLRKLPITTGMENVTVNGWELGEGLFLYSLIVNGQEIDTKRMIMSK